MIIELFGILVILIMLVEIYRHIRRYWILRHLDKKKNENRPFCGQKANVTAGFVEMRRENGQLSSEKSRAPGRWG